MAHFGIPRRTFIKGITLTSLLSVMPPLLRAQPTPQPKAKATGAAKNIIFLVVDGMNQGALSLAEYFSRQTFNNSTHWKLLYDQPEVTLHRGLMETSSANALVTDSAAAGSAWGCGRKVDNRAINMAANGQALTPIFSKAKAAGKACGLVSTARITHATPASFAANVAHRDEEDTIAVQYLEREIDILLGGGSVHFAPNRRKDQRNLFLDYSRAGYAFATDAEALAAIPKNQNRILGIFGTSHLPYALDRRNQSELGKKIPPLNVMMQAALERLSQHAEGFVLQVEGARVDHAGHANDPAALVWEQLEFDRCIPLALEFQRRNPDTLVILTTDHGTGGIMLNGAGEDYLETDDRLKRLQGFTQSFEDLAEAIPPGVDASAAVKAIEKATGLSLTTQQKQEVKEIISQMDRNSDYGPKAIGRWLGNLVYQATAVSFTSQNHTGDMVELCAWGPGSEQIKAFQDNHEVHDYMVKAMGIA